MSAAGEAPVGRALRTLDTVRAGDVVVLEHVDAVLAANFCDQLASYGLVPGRALRVVARRPMTVVVCDHVELALEEGIVRALVVR